MDNSTIELMENFSKYFKMRFKTDIRTIPESITEPTDEIELLCEKIKSEYR